MNNHDQSNEHDSMCNNTNGLKRLLPEKKRKKESESDKCDSPTNCEGDKLQTPENMDYHLYPLFTKKPKDKRETRRNKKKKTKKDDAVERLFSLSEESLQVLDVRTVLSLYDKVKTVFRDYKDQQADELDRLQKQIDKAATQNRTGFAKEVDKASTKIKMEVEKDVQKAMNEYEERIKTLEESLDRQKATNNIHAQLLIHNHSIIEDLAGRLDKIEISNARRSAVLTGLTFSTKKEDRNCEIESFIEETLGVSVSVEDSYFLGSADNKPVVIIFENLKDKNRVFVEKEKLQHFEGKNGKSIYLNSYLPAQLNEKKHREREVAKQAKEANPKVTVEHDPAGVKIGKKQNQKRILPPNPANILELTGKELDTILNRDIVKGPAIQIKNNVLIAYSADISDFNDINEIYLKVKLMHARARHIPCAYNLPGQPIYQHQDYQDDGDHGVGRVLLNFLLENEMKNKAIFVARFTEKQNQKLNADRMSSYVKAAIACIQVNDYNMLLKTKQPVISSGQKATAQHRQRTVSTLIKKKTYAVKRSAIREGRAKRTNNKTQYSAQSYSDAAKIPPSADQNSECENSCTK